MLFHLHGVRPVSLALENQNLKVLRILHDKLTSHGLLNVDVLFILPLRLGELERLAKPQHSTAAILVIAPVVIVPQPVLILRGLDQEKHTLLVWSVFACWICCIHLSVSLSLYCFNHFLYFKIKTQISSHMGFWGFGVVVVVGAFGL